MNWGSLARLLLQLSLLAVPMVEKIAGDAMKGASKKQLAIEGIQAALGASEAVDPNDSQTAEAAAVAAGSIVDAVVAIGNKTGDLKKITPTAPATTAPAPQPAQPQPQVSGLG